VTDCALPAGDSEFSFQAFITTNNTIFLFTAISVAYGMVGGRHSQHSLQPASRQLLST
jgi:hypothetical protein